MRTLAKDIRRMVQITTLNPVPNAASGNGIFSDGTSWHSVRSATGQYDVYFDNRLIPISGFAGFIQAARIDYFFELFAPGQVRVQTLLSMVILQTYNLI